MRTLEDQLERLGDRLWAQKIKVYYLRGLLESVHPAHPQPEICEACKEVGRQGGAAQAEGRR